MQGVFKISEAVSIAFHTIVIIINREDKLITTKELSDTLNVSDHHLSKVMQRLVKTGYIISTRGPGGGFKFNPLKQDATLLDIYEDIEGQIPVNDCLLEDAPCPTCTCILGNFPTKVNRDFKTYLQSRKLNDLKILK